MTTEPQTPDPQPPVPQASTPQAPADATTADAVRHTEQFPRTEPVKFSGQAGEFFGIWFVNNILTWMTLGIYSAWAKVRTYQYFYGNTELAGGSFSFTAKPLQILKSRVIAFALLVLFVIADNNPAEWALYVYLVFVIAYLTLAPVLTVLVMSFQLRYSSWRGIAFRFNKDYKGAYRVYLPPLAMLLLLAGSFALPFYSEEIKGALGIEVVASEQVAADPASLEPVITEPQKPVAAQTGASEPAGVATPQGEGLIKYKYGVGNPNATNGDRGSSISAEILGRSSSGAGAGSGIKKDIENDFGENLEQELESSPYWFLPSGVILLLFLLALPYFDFISQRFLARNVRFGTAEVTYSGTAKDYYVVYWRWMLATAALVTLWIWVVASDFPFGGGIMTLLFLATMLYFPLTKAYLKSKRYNLLFGKCVIDNGRFHLKADVPFLKLAFVLITNTIMVTITFGLMTAWAKVRTARVILEHMALDVNAPLDSFVAAQENQQSALAEEVADVFDIDVAF